jgi:site-specific recombinase XerD
MNDYTAQIAGFADYLRNSTRLRPTSQKTYVGETRRFLRWTLAHAGPAGLTPAALLSWNQAQVEQELASSTISQKHAALTRFFQYLQDFSDDPGAARLVQAMRHLQVPEGTGRRRDPYALPAEAIGMMLGAVGQKIGTGVRDRAVLSFLWDTGCRNSELLGLTLERLDIFARTAQVIGKGNKERTVIFSTGCQQDLVSWLKERQNWPQKTQWVFISVGGLKMQSALVCEIVKRGATAAGIKTEVWPHLLRHTRVTELLQRGMPLQQVARFAGHTNPTTTMGYFHIDDSELRESYDAVMDR